MKIVEAYRRGLTGVTDFEPYFKSGKEMAESLFFHSDVTAEIDVPEKGILSQTLLQRDAVRVVLFAFAAGEELSEHTASRPAVLHILDGEFELTLGSERHEGGPGAWMYLPAGTPHSLRAKSPARLMLYLLR